MPEYKYIKLAQDYYKFLRSKGICIDLCYLFGSYVTGHYTKKSDIDILLVSNCFLFISKKHLNYLYNITEDYNKKLDIFLFSLYWFKERNPTLNNNYLDICNNGIYCIYYPIHKPPKPLSLPPHRII